MAGDESNDVYIHVQHSGMPALISEGCFIDWNTLPNIDFSKPYWYSNCIRDINYGTKVFAMTGMYNLEILRFSNILTFNKRIFDDLQLAYPYQDVPAGTDQFGYWGWVWEQVSALFMGLGGDLVTKDKDNMPVLTVDTEKNIAIVDKMNEIFAMDGAAYERTTYGTFDKAFKSGLLMFNHNSLADMTNNCRDMEDDFGFIPYPKLDESQEGYNARIGNCAGLSYIPTTNTRGELTGAVLEVMSAVSYNTVVPAFFDVALTLRIRADDTDHKRKRVLLRRSGRIRRDRTHNKRFRASDLLRRSQE